MVTSEDIRERGRTHTAWSGAVRMPDGVDYHGPVWKVPGKDGLYIYYQNRLYRVYWDTDHYSVGP